MGSGQTVGASAPLGNGSGVHRILEALFGDDSPKTEAAWNANQTTAVGNTTAVGTLRGKGDAVATVRSRGAQVTDRQTALASVLTGVPRELVPLPSEAIKAGSCA